MSEDKKYNGWTNYETWNVALWIGNEQITSSYWEEMAQNCWDEATEGGMIKSFTREDNATAALRELLKSEIEDQNPLADDASMWSDLMSAALSEVNWHEIAEHYIADVDKAEAEEATEEA